MSADTVDDELILREDEENKSNSSRRRRGCLGKKSIETSINSENGPNIRDDDDLLLDDHDCGLWRKLKRIQWFWAEPVFFLYMFCDFPINLTAQKYILEWITMYNWDRDMASNVTYNFTIENSTSINFCNANASSPEYAFNQKNQMMSSYYGMLRMAVWVIPAMFSTLVLGSVSDKYGRKWVFIPPTVGTFVCCLAFIPILYFKGSILWLLIMDFASGLSGSFGCIILAGVSYVVGKTTIKNRFFRLTILQLFLLAGSTASPFAMGQAYYHLGPVLTIVIVTVITGINLIYCLSCIPAMKVPKNSGLVIDVDYYAECAAYAVEEREIKDNAVETQSTTSTEAATIRTAEQQSQINQISRTEGGDSQGILSNTGSQTTTSGSSSFNLIQQISNHLRNTCMLYTSTSAHHKISHEYDTSTLSSMAVPSVSLTESTDHISQQDLKESVCRLRILICAFFVIIIPYFDGVIMTLFELNSPLCWDPATIGLYTGVCVAIAAMGSIILTPLMERFLSHITVAIICCIASAVSRVYLYFVWDTKSMFYGVVLNIFNTMLVPNIRTMMTLLVDSTKYGAILGSISAVEILCCFLGTVIFSIIYSATLFISTALVFLVSASFFALGSIIFMAYRVKYGSVAVVGPIQEILA